NVWAREIGKAYDLKYFRGGKEHTTQVVLSAAESVVFDAEKAPKDESESKAEAKTPVNDFGLEVQPLTAELAKGLGLSDTKGLLVSSVKEGSPAQAAGLEPG